jgi:hypothetical protein
MAGGAVRNPIAGLAFREAKDGPQFAASVGRRMSLRAERRAPSVNGRHPSAQGGNGRRRPPIGAPGISCNSGLIDNEFFLLGRRSQ